MALSHRRVLAAICVAPLAGLVGCGKGLSGTYVKCISVNASSSKLATFTFPDAASVTYTAKSYAAAACAGAATPITESVGTFTETASTVSGAKNIDVTFTSGSLSGTSLFQIYKLDNNQLYLGDTTSSVNDASTEAKRPLTLESTAYVRP